MQIREEPRRPRIWLPDSVTNLNSFHNVEPHFWTILLRAWQLGYDCYSKSSGDLDSADLYYSQ